MNINKVLGVIVAGCLMVTAFSIVDYTKSIKTKVQPIVKTVVRYLPAPIDEMPVREVVKVDGTQLDCMAKNLYFEARNQKSDKAMAAVGFVVVNRVNNKYYPKTVCDVVYQKSQFSWTLDKSLMINKKNPLERKEWERARRIALEILNGSIKDNTNGATHYHATYVSPKWARASRMKYTIKYGAHLFYKDIKIV